MMAKIVQPCLPINVFLSHPGHLTEDNLALGYLLYKGTAEPHFEERLRECQSSHFLWNIEQLLISEGFLATLANGAGLRGWHIDFEESMKGSEDQILASKFLAVLGAIAEQRKEGQPPALWNWILEVCDSLVDEAFPDLFTDYTNSDISSSSACSADQGHQDMLFSEAVVGLGSTIRPSIHVGQAFEGISGSKRFGLPWSIRTSPR